jgi:hypothetical protein
MSWYLTIRSDDFYSDSTDAERLGHFLRGLPGLVEVKPQSFANQSDDPWLLIHVAKCDCLGNYTMGDTFQATINVVELICSELGDRGWYERIAVEIARFLGWEAFVEHEARWVWPSTFSVV